MTTNLTIISGNLGANPDLRYTPNTNIPVVSVSLAHTPRQFNRDTQQWEDGTTQWVKLTAWRGLAERMAATLHKGSAVVVRGKAGVEAWADKNTGEPRAALTINADDVWEALPYPQQNTAPANQGGWSNTNQGGWNNTAPAAQPAQADNDQPPF